MTRRNTGKSSGSRASKAGARTTRPKAAATKAAPARSITATEAVKAAVAAEANARRQRPAAGSLQPVITISRDEIAQRAYLIWLAKGKPQGQDEANWLQAEAELAAVPAHA